MVAMGMLALALLAASRPGPGPEQICEMLAATGGNTIPGPIPGNSRGSWIKAMKACRVRTSLA